MNWDAPPGDDPGGLMVGLFAVAVVVGIVVLLALQLT